MSLDVHYGAEGDPAVKRLALCLALNTGCMASYAIQSRHDEPRMATPTWRVGVDMSLLVAGGVVAVTAPEGPHWIGFGAALGIWAVDMVVMVATDRKD